MIGLDTNVLVRCIVQDDPVQSAPAARLVDSLTAEVPGFVPVVELGWMLSSAYGLDRKQLAAAVEALLRSKEIVVERSETVWKALRLFTGAKADFADCLIASAASVAGCERTMTFDRGAVKGCAMVLIGDRWISGCVLCP
jgi:predicted nucleic-acid-binding protein